MNYLIATGSAHGIYWQPTGPGSPAYRQVWWQPCCGRFAARYHHCFEEGGSG